MQVWDFSFSPDHWFIQPTFAIAGIRPQANKCFTPNNLRKESFTNLSMILRIYDIAVIVQQKAVDNLQINMRIECLIAYFWQVFSSFFTIFFQYRHLMLSTSLV